MPEIRDRYRVIQELSSTLYGWVFVCEDMGNFAPAAASISSVVIKQVSLERMANISLANPTDDRLPDNPIVEKEVGDLVRCAGGHPNLVQYQDSFVELQTLFLVMEHCADGDLHGYLSSCPQPRMSCVSALSVLSQVASGLAFLHGLGIAHRDISLENIMLHHGRCKLGDFGLATRSRQAGGQLVGKNYYMAPEIVAGGEYDSKRADVWSLGIVFFVLVTGSPLVPMASTSVKSFRVIKRAGVTSVLRSWGMEASMSTSALQLLSGMLEIDPRKRLTITQVLEHEALTQCLGVYAETL